jgi:hypothetical protein
MTHAELVEVVRRNRGVGGKVRRDVERAMGWPPARFGKTAEWYRQWEAGLAARLAKAYEEVFAWTR